MADYITQQDPFYHFTMIWGARPEIERLSWIEKRHYLKQRFAIDGVLVTLIRARHLLIGEDADRAYPLAQNRLDVIQYRPSEFGTVLLLSSRGDFPGLMHQHGIRLYKYFGGGAFEENVNELFGILDFLTPPPPIPTVTFLEEPLEQQQLWPDGS